MKFLVDMPLSPALATWLVELGHDAIHAATLGLHRAPDIEIIACAKREGRTIVTADLDYPRLLAMARSSEPSLILFRSGKTGRKGRSVPGCAKYLRLWLSWKSRTALSSWTRSA